MLSSPPLFVSVFGSLCPVPCSLKLLLLLSPIRVPGTQPVTDALLDLLGKLDPDLDPEQSRKQDPNSHQSEKVEALEGYFGAWEGPSQEKNVSGSA